MTILKNPLAKKHCEGKVKQFCSWSNFLQKSMSSSMSLKFSVSIFTIMYMAARLWTGLIPLILESLSYATFEASPNFYLRESKKLSGTFLKI